MTKVTVDLSKDEIVRILSQLSGAERAEIMGKVEKGQGVLKPLVIPIEEVAKLKGLVSVGGDAVKDSEHASVNKDFDAIAWLKRVEYSE